MTYDQKIRDGWEGIKSKKNKSKNPGQLQNVLFFFDFMPLSHPTHHSKDGGKGIHCIELPLSVHLRPSPAGHLCHLCLGNRKKAPLYTTHEKDGVGCGGRDRQGDIIANKRLCFQGEQSFLL